MSSVPTLCPVCGATTGPQDSACDTCGLIFGEAMRLQELRRLRLASSQ